MMSSEDSPAKMPVTVISDSIAVSMETNRNIEEAHNIILPISGATSPTDDAILSLDSSLLASLRGDDDFNLDTKDLIVKVDNPEKHSGAMDSYITFRICTKTNRPDFDNHEFSVRRRYSDFLWLRSRLEAQHPTHLIPPLPEKHSFNRLSRFTPNFIKARMNALNKFLLRITDHPVLSFSDNLKVFITLEAWEFAAHRKQGTSLISRFSESFHNMAATYMMKDRSPEYEDMSVYINRLGEKIGVLERISQRIQKEQQEYVAELDEFHPVLSLWSGSESKLQKGMVALATAVAKCSEAQKDMIEENELKLCGSLREYSLYADAIKEVLKRRDAIQIEYGLTIEELNRRKTDRDQLAENESAGYVGSFLGKNSDEAKQDKREKLNQIIEELIGQVEVNNDKVEVANEDLKADMERWQNTKEKDFKAIYSNLANKQINYYQNCLSYWEEAINEVKNSDLPDNQQLDEEGNDII
ncbi:Sorting nexin-30 [Nymphon striatum]|nr:Sorting nexin-30 [Nymphon striatum]